MLDFGYILNVSQWDFLMVWIFMCESKKGINDNTKCVGLSNRKRGFHPQRWGGRGRRRYGSQGEGFGCAQFEMLLRHPGEDGELFLCSSLVLPARPSLWKSIRTLPREVQYSACYLTYINYLNYLFIGTYYLQQINKQIDG